MKVFVVYDPLLEEVISVHKNEENARKRCKEKNKEFNRYELLGPSTGRDFEFDEYELEE